MTKLNEIFQKPLDRAIEGVIKADDNSSLKNEIEEYVLTNEISQGLENFLEAYNIPHNVNGAWISGFFGSGKSHLLKILSFVLENKIVDGVPTLDLFLPKCGDNAILKGSLQKATGIPSKSILFNIDQKADVISKSQVDALLTVFIKVFDEMCGYYGKQGYIAQFERDLNKKKFLQPFRRAFQSIAGISWETGREQVVLEARHIDQAYLQICGLPEGSAGNILDKYRADFKVSIEDFALQVNEYIESQGKDFRLNFFVDEVGQYIANNSKLMVNLQTIAESLATKCRGHAWIIVTSQEEMKAVLGEINRQSEFDFSKIQARLAIRLKLTSQNVDEVIQKRLLAKQKGSVPELEAIYYQQVNNFGTLFDFSDGSQTYRNFQGLDHFVNCYPFVPYQFALFQAAIQALSEHGAFEGRHSSVGERSMLAVFQHVAVQIAQHETGWLASFDLFFDGIRATIRSQNQQSILIAENNLDNAFAVQVLKALFLVKYIKGFKPTLHNVSILLIGHFNLDIAALRKQAAEALSLLEQQTYIQRNGDFFEYLTNEEKDIEQEIKATEVDMDMILTELGKIIFDQVIGEKKITYADNKQDFPFSKKLDEQLIGREYEVAIRVISPFHEHAGNEEILRMQSMGRDELLIILPANSLLIQDLLLYKKTEKYLLQAGIGNQRDVVRQIMTEKGQQNNTRSRQLEQTVRSMLSGAKMFVSGSEIEVNGGDPLTRVQKGFQELIRRVYPNLSILRNVSYSENEIEKYLDQNSPMLITGSPNGLTEAEREMLSFIQSNHQNAIRTTLKSLTDRFERKPYGWPLPAIQCNLALLFAHGKLDTNTESIAPDNKTLAKSLRNTQEHASVVLLPQIEFSSAQVHSLKNFYQDFFDRPPQSNDARELGRETGEAILALGSELERLTADQKRFPFLTELSEPLSRLKALSGKSYAFYLTDLPEQADALLALKDSAIDPIRRFLNSSLRGRYEETSQFCQSQSENFSYLASDESARLQTLLYDPEIFRGDRMQQALALVEKLKQAVDAKREAEKQETASSIHGLKEKLSALQEYTGLSAEDQQWIDDSFANALTQLARQTLIASIRDLRRTFEEAEYPRLLTELTNRQRKKTAEKAPEPGETGGQRCAEPKVEYVSRRTIPVPFEKAWLADEQDIEDYLAALREAYRTEIKNGRRIQI